MKPSGGQARWNDWNNHGGPKYPHEKVVQFMFRNYPAGARSGLKVLDLGCGSGVHARFLAAEGFEVYGTDISPVGIRNSAALLKEHGLHGSLKVEGIDQIGFPDGHFDCVLSIGVLDCAGPAVASRAVGEIVRVLKAGGKALLCFASDSDFRVRGENPLGLHGYNDAEVDALLPTRGLSIRWIDRYITTQKNRAEEQNDYLITLQKE